MDNTMYSVNGSAPLSKGRMVLEVVEGFCTKPRTAEEVKKAFGSIIMEEKLAKSKADETGHKRHFLDRPIKLKVGTYVVSNQWRLDGIDKFIEKAKAVGYKIEVAKNVEKASKKPAAEPTKKVADKKLALEIEAAIDKVGKKAPAKKSAPKKAAKKVAAKKKAAKK